MENTNKFANSREVIGFLVESFPQCFSVEGDARALKVGIFQDIVERLADEPRLSKTLLRSSLRHYTNSWRYLHAIKTGAFRIDLDGNKCEEIGQEHAEHAEKQLAESKAKVAQQRKQSKEKASDGKAGFKGRSRDSKEPGKAAPRPSRKTTGTRPTPQRLTDETLVVGTKVTVKIGKAPMSANITEVAKDGVHVQLNTGMVVKVKPENLRLATK